MHSERPRNVEQTAEGIRFVFRAEGFFRYFIVAFLALWLCGWAVGEAFAINVLLAFAGVSAQIPLPFGIPPFRGSPESLGVAGFVLLWLTLWTVGGIGALVSLLRLLFGSDTVELGPSWWGVTTSYGLWSSRHEFQAVDGWSAELRRRDHALVARREEKTRTVTSLGTQAERRWMRDEIVRRYGEPRRDTRPLPKEFESVPAPDGSIMIQRTRHARRGAIGCGIFALLIWNVPFGLWTAYRYSRGEEMGAGLIAGAIVALLFTGLALWCFASRESWRMRRDFLEKRLDFLGFTKHSVFDSGSLAIESYRDSDGDEHFQLIITDRTGRRKSFHRSMGEPEQTLQWGRFIAAQTGWELHLPDDLK